MLKLAGSLLIIGATTLWGMAAAERLREQYEQMRLLQSLLYALRSEILYAKRQAFLSARSGAEEYKSLFGNPGLNKKRRINCLR